MLMNDGRSFPSTISPQFGQWTNPARCTSLILRRSTASGRPHPGQAMFFVIVTSKNKDPDFSPDERSGPSESVLLKLSPLLYHWIDVLRNCVIADWRYSTARKVNGELTSFAKRPQLILAIFGGMVAVVGFGCGESRLTTEKPKADLPQFDHVGRFEDGLAPVRKGVMWAYADESGTALTRFIYEEAEAFEEGLAAVKMKGKWGFIDKTGRIVIEPQF